MTREEIEESHIPGNYWRYPIGTIVECKDDGQTYVSISQHTKEGMLNNILFSIGFASSTGI